MYIFICRDILECLTNVCFYDDFYTENYAKHTVDTVLRNILFLLKDHYRSDVLNASFNFLTTVFKRYFYNIYFCILNLFYSLIM